MSTIQQVKIILILFMLSITMIGCSQNSNKVNEFDTLFTDISSDSLQIFISGYSQGDNHKQWIGEDIPQELIELYNLNNDASIALGKIYFDDKKETIGYLIGNAHKNLIFLYIYSEDKEQSILDITIASNTYIEGAYQEITNSWIIDLNNNGRLDIAIWNSLTDFEMANDLSGNISKDEKFTYINMGGDFEYGVWNSEILTDVTLNIF